MGFEVVLKVWDLLGKIPTLCMPSRACQSQKPWRLKNTIGSGRWLGSRFLDRTHWRSRFCLDQTVYTSQEQSWSSSPWPSLVQKELLWSYTGLLPWLPWLLLLDCSLTFCSECWKYRQKKDQKSWCIVQITTQPLLVNVSLTKTRKKRKSVWPKKSQVVLIRCRFESWLFCLYEQHWHHTLVTESSPPQLLSLCLLPVSMETTDPVVLLFHRPHGVASSPAIPASPSPTESNPCRSLEESMQMLFVFHN